MARDNWGAAARLGIFIVGVEAVPEAEWWAMAPAGVSVHAARVTASAPWARWTAGRAAATPADDLVRGAAQFAGMGLSAVTIAHTSSSIVGGEGWDDAAEACLRPLLPASTAITTNGRDCALALRSLGVRRPFIVYPPWFGEATMAAGARYFSTYGFEAIPGLRAAPPPGRAHVRPEEMYRDLVHMDQDAERLCAEILAACPATADGVLIAGTGLRCVGVIAALEAALARPVVTANQAGLWRCLRLAGAGAPIAGYGRLLSGAAGPV